MMELSQIRFCLVLLICLSLSTSLCVSTLISDGVFGSSVLSERRHLQVRKQCPINFELQNYTIITSKCRGPEYPANLCCSAFLEFACPFADDLNDSSNDCGATMFSYINLHGKYPPGLFASECRGEKEGLRCPAPPPGSSQSAKANNNSGSWVVCDLFPATMIAVATLVLSM